MFSYVGFELLRLNYDHLLTRDNSSEKLVPYFSYQYIYLKTIQDLVTHKL